MSSTREHRFALEPAGVVILAASYLLLVAGVLGMILALGWILTLVTGRPLQPNPGAALIGVPIVILASWAPLRFLWFGARSVWCRGPNGLIIDHERIVFLSEQYLVLNRTDISGHAHLPASFRREAVRFDLKSGKQVLIPTGFFPGRGLAVIDALKRTQPPSGPWTAS